MKKTEETNPTSQWRVPSEDSKPGIEDGVPLSVRNARRMRQDWWPSIWMSFTSIILLAGALVILSYRIGAQSCH
jgi:hypothetical protein